MISPEDIKTLVKHFESVTSDDESLTKLISKLNLIAKQVEVQEEMNEKILAIQEEMKNLEKED